MTGRRAPIARVILAVVALTGVGFVVGAVTAPPSALAEEGPCGGSPCGGVDGDAGPCGDRACGEVPGNPGPCGDTPCGPVPEGQTPNQTAPPAAPPPTPSPTATPPPATPDGTTAPGGQTDGAAPPATGVPVPPPVGDAAPDLEVAGNEGSDATGWAIALAAAVLLAAGAVGLAVRRRSGRATTP